MEAANKQRLSALNDAVLPKFKSREALQAQLLVATDPLLKDSLQERILLLRNEIVEKVIKDVPDFLDAIAFKWNNSFSYDEAHSFVLENLVEATERYTTTKQPFCKFTSFFWMYNKNLLRNRLKTVHATKRDSRMTHSLDALTAIWNTNGMNTKHEAFCVDENILEHCANKAIVSALYKKATPKQQKVIESLCLGYTQSEIARELNVTGTNVNMVIKRLRKELEQMM